MRFSFVMTVMLAGCGSKTVGSDAGAAEEPIVTEYTEYGSDTRYSWTPGTVLDTTTNLTWDRNGSERLTWGDAEKYCAQLGERMPTREELLTILSADHEPAPFAVPSAGPLAGSDDWYWSSTPSDNVANAAWVVGIARYTNTDAFETKSRVRCVR